MIRFYVVCAVFSSACFLVGQAIAQEQVTKRTKSTDRESLLFKDDFERTETDDSKEELGNGWGTNSKKRAKGNKQADLKDGAMWIRRHPSADHAVSVVKDLEFRNARIEMRFKIGEGDDLGVNLADMQEKSVHAGHLCVARIRLNRVEVTDLKTGRMKLEIRELKLAGKLGSDQKKALNMKTKYFKVSLKPDVWHQLVIEVRGDSMSVDIDGRDVGEFQSPGIAHPTKRRLRLSVAKTAVVDDLLVFGTP